MRLTRRHFNRLIEHIEFTKLQPMEPINKEARILSWDNVNFSERDDEMRRFLAPLRRVEGKMSTAANAFLIYSISQHLEENEAYLNIGVWKGFTFLAGVLNRSCLSIGVDNFSLFGGPKAEFHANYDKFKHERSSFFEMDYKQYLAEQHGDTPIGFYFYDGAHDYQNQFDALVAAERLLSKNAIVLVDDTNFPDAWRATLDFVRDRHPRFEIIFDQFTAGNLHPTYHNGLMLLRKVG